MKRFFTFLKKLPFVGGVLARYEAAMISFGAKRWLLGAYQDARYEVDFSNSMEICRKHIEFISNCPLVQRIRNLKIQFAVGVDGLVAIPNASDPDMDPAAVEQWNELRSKSWEAFCKNPDLGSNMSLSELTIQWEGTLFDVGNIIVLKTTDENGAPKIQTIDRLRLRTPPGLLTEEGKTVFGGIKLKKISVPVVEVAKDGKRRKVMKEILTGKPESYFIRDEFDDTSFAEVPAENVIHKFRALRPGMLVGIPDGFASIPLLHDFTDLHKLEMDAAKLAADIGTVETNPTGELNAQRLRQAALNIPISSATTTSSRTVQADYEVTLGAKKIALRSGDKLENFMVTRPTVAQQEYWDFLVSQICVGYNVPKLLVVPYTLQGTVTRADLDVCATAFRADFEIVASVVREIYEWITKDAGKYNIGLQGVKRPANYLDCIIRPPRAPNVDIGYTAQALALELEMGVKTFPDVCAENNRDWKEVYREIAESEAYKDKLAEEYGISPDRIAFKNFQSAKSAQGNAEPKDGETSNTETAQTADALAFIPVVRGQNELTVKNKGDTAEISVIGTIGKSWWDDSGITEKEFRDALNTIPEGKQISVIVNSEGGSVKEGLGIYNAIKDRNKDIQVRISGYALSIASVFPLAAKKSMGGRGVVSPKSAIWMQHKAWSVSQGNADDMRQAAEMLDVHDNTLVDIYAEATGKTKASIRAAMEKETWTKGADAIGVGLADETDEEDADAVASYRLLDREFIKRCKNLSPEILNAISPIGAKPNQPNAQIMNKEQMIALLKEWGIEIKDDTTDAQLIALVKAGKPTKKPEMTPEQRATVAAADQVTRAEFDAIKAQLSKANEDRIRARVNTFVEARKITNDEAEIFVKAAQSDEKGTFDILEKKTAEPAGGSPVSVTFIEGGSDVIMDITRKSGAYAKADARLKKFNTDWKAIYDEACRRDRRNGLQPFEGEASVFNGNTLSATVTTSFLIDGALTPLQNMLAPLRAFSIDFTVDPYKPLATGVMKNPTAFPSTKTDATDFTANSDSTIGALSVTMHQYTQPFNVSNADLNSGLRMQDLVFGNVKTFASKLIEVATAPCTVANFTGTPVTSSAAAFGFSDLAFLQGSLKKAPIKNVILDGEYIASIANTPGFFQSAGTVGGSPGAWAAFGWDGIYLNTDWTGAGANVRGFACNPQAILGVAGIPLTPVSNVSGGLFSVQTITLPDLQLSVNLYNWFDVNARKSYTSYDAMLGVTLGDATAGVIIKSA